MTHDKAEALAYLIKKTKELGRRFTYAEAAAWSKDDPTAPRIERILYLWGSFDDAVEKAWCESGLSTKPTAAIKRPLKMTDGQNLLINPQVVAKTKATAKPKSARSSPVATKKQVILTGTEVTRNRFLHQLAEIATCFGYIPSVGEFEAYVEQKGLPPYAEFVKQVGTRSEWHSKLKAVNLLAEGVSPFPPPKPEPSMAESPDTKEPTEEPSVVEKQPPVTEKPPEEKAPAESPPAVMPQRQPTPKSTTKQATSTRSAGSKKSKQPDARLKFQYTKEELIRYLTILATEMGKIPPVAVFNAEAAKRHWPVYMTFRNRLGNPAKWPQLIGQPDLLVEIRPRKSRQE